MIPKSKYKYGCRYMYISYGYGYQSVCRYKNTKEAPYKQVFQSSFSNLITFLNLTCQAWTYGAFWHESFPLWFSSGLSYLLLIWPCPLASSFTSRSRYSLAWILEGFTPFTSWKTQGFCWCHLNNFPEKNCWKPKQWHEATCNPETNPKTLLHPSQLLRGQISMANSCQTMETAWSDLPQSPQSPQCFLAIHLLAPKFHKRKLKMKSKKKLPRKKNIFSGCWIHSGVPWSICFGPPSVVVLLLQHCAAQTELHVGQRGTTWDEERCKEICLDKVLLLVVIPRVRWGILLARLALLWLENVLETARKSCASPAATFT